MTDARDQALPPTPERNRSRDEMMLVGYDGSEDARTAIVHHAESHGHRRALGSGGDCARKLRPKRCEVTREPSAQPEGTRLEQRAEQLEGVLKRLRVRVRAPDAGAAERTGLGRAAGDFARELAQTRQLLNDRDGDRDRSHSHGVRSRPA